MLKSLPLLFIALFFASNLYAAFPIDYDAKLDATKTPVTLSLPNDNTVTVTLSPASPKPMQPFTANFTFKNTADIYSVDFDTNMQMNMGKYDFNIKPNAQGLFLKQMTLPKCGSGRTMWYGKVTINYTNGMKDIRYIFYDVK